MEGGGREGWREEAGRDGGRKQGGEHIHVYTSDVVNRHTHLQPAWPLARCHRTRHQLALHSSPDLHAPTQVRHSMFIQEKGKCGVLYMYVSCHRYNCIYTYIYMYTYNNKECILHVHVHCVFTVTLYNVCTSGAM